MRFFFSLVLLIIIGFTATSQDNSREFELKEGDKTHTMKQYYMVILLKGDNRTHSKEEAAKIQEAHLTGINRLTEAGIIQISGPFGHKEDPKGIFIMDVKSLEEADKYVRQDPAVLAGRLKYKIYPWWGAKGSTLK